MLACGLSHKLLVFFLDILRLPTEKTPTLTHTHTYSSLGLQTKVDVTITREVTMGQHGARGWLNILLFVALRLREFVVYCKNTLSVKIMKQHQSTNTNHHTTSGRVNVSQKQLFLEWGEDLKNTG